MTDAPSAPAPVPAPEAWYHGADAETVGFLQTRGWDKLDAKTTALNAVKSYRETEKVIGAPPDQILRMPKDANDVENWSKLHTRLGVPADAKLYDFSNVKHEDGTELNADIANTLRTQSHAAKLTPSQATEMARTVAKMLDEAEKTEASNYTAKLAIEKDTLAKNWGSNQAQFKVIAENAAARLGVTQEEVAALEKTIGYARVMEMFRNVGQRIGEDRFITNNLSNGGHGLMTREQAQSTLDSRMKDTAWVEKYMNGGVNEVQEFHNLTRIVAGQ